MKSQEVYLTTVTSLVGIFGLLFTWLQFRLAKKKRKDDLFNLRYTFYKKASEMWVSTCSADCSPLDIVDLIPYAEEAGFLFGKEVSEHILSLVNKKASHEFFPDDDFSKPFRKYLNLT